jgi:hypothetical protein
MSSADCNASASNTVNESAPMVADPYFPGAEPGYRGSSIGGEWPATRG